MKGLRIFQSDYVHEVDRAVVPIGAIRKLVERSDCSEFTGGFAAASYRSMEAFFECCALRLNCDRNCELAVSMRSVYTTGPSSYAEQTNLPAVVLVDIVALSTTGAIGQ